MCILISVNYHYISINNYIQSQSTNVFHCTRTTEGERLVKALVTIKILSKVQLHLLDFDGHLASEIGSVSDKILYFFLNCPMTRSTCIITLASCLELSTSCWGNYTFPLVNAGIFKCAPNTARSSDTLKPLSAKITSPHSICSKKPHLQVIIFSETRPPQACEMKQIDPFGDTAINTLAVWSFL